MRLVAYGKDKEQCGGGAGTISLIPAVIVLAALAFAALLDHLLADHDEPRDRTG